MTIRPLRLWPDPILSEVCAPASGDVAALARDLADTMYDAEGRGLAAPQIGEAVRVFVMDAGWKEDGAGRKPMAFVNPKVVEQPDDTVSGVEECLSIPGVEAEVSRAPWIILSWTDLEGARVAKRFDGAAAVIIQHELDHLDGVVTFDRLSDEDRKTLEAAYAG